MTAYSKKSLLKILDNFHGRKILVIGDLILDTYLEGQIRRISPEAPVPLVEIDSEYSNPGGAANVANNIRTLGGVPILVGTIGIDRGGERFLEVLKKLDMNNRHILALDNKKTTVKTRIIGQRRQVLRVDTEDRSDITKETEDRLLHMVADCIGEVDGLVFEDYNKGLLTPRLIHETIALARKADRVITVDPKFRNFFEYSGITVFKPNQHEIERIFGIDPYKQDERLHEIMADLLGRLQARATLVTRGEKGMVLLEEDGAFCNLKSIAKEVFDVSGAGDTVISVCTLALCAGASFRDAMFLANVAGGIEVGKTGVATVSGDELRTTLNDRALSALYCG